MKDFRSLKVWEKAPELTLTVYKSIQEFPKGTLCPHQSNSTFGCVNPCEYSRRLLANGYLLKETI